MRRIKLTIGYDGTDFCGWQIQRNGRTVQQEIEKVLETMHGHHVRLHGSGRTDSGVHASGQVAHFDTDIASIVPEKFAVALNSRLPRDVRIYSSSEVDADFHARFSAKSRSYRYVIKEYPAISPMEQRYCLGVPKLPSIQVLNGYARYLTGVHDFTTFAAAGDVSESKTRELYQASWYIEGDALIFSISGNAFLWKMVRSLVGTMLSLHEQKEPAEQMRQLLHKKDRSLAGTTAPPHGLCLERIWYE